MSTFVKEEGICCFGANFERCSCPWGFSCLADHVVGDMCVEPKCIGNCKIGYELIAVLCGALVLLVVIIVGIVCLCCHHKDD